MESAPALLALLFMHMSTGERLYNGQGGSKIQSQPRDKAESILSKTYAQAFLLKYGWMEPVRWDSLPFRGVSSLSSEEEEKPPSPVDVSSFLSDGRPPSSTHLELPEHPEPTLNPRFIGALKRFQEANRLKVTGELDEATREAMNAPRCGVPDRKVPVVEKTEDVNPTERDTSIAERGQYVDSSQGTAPPIMAASERMRRELRGGGKRVQPETEDNQELGRHVRKKRSDLLRLGTKNGAFSKVKIKWRLLGEGYSVWLTIDQQRSILMRAFRIWSEVVPLNFEEDLTSPAHLIDIKLGFGTRRHLGCSQLFDGMGREFAHAWRLGDIHFDDDEHFVPPNSDQGISLLKVAVHEIGHVLGLSHMNRITSVMQPNYIPANSRMELDGTDRRAIQRIYGRCSGSFSTVFDWVHQDRSSPGNRVFQTYFFRKSWYWMYENRSKRTRYRDPRVLSNGWRGIPDSDIDAFLHIWTRDKDLTLFFKGTQYWRYDNENDRAYVQDPEGHVYPRLISEGFPGIRGPIDTAFYDRKERNVYFFRGRNVTAFSVDNHTVVPGYPRAITDVFPTHVDGDHPQSDLDAVYFSFAHKSIFFIKDEYVWRMVGDRDPQYSAPPYVLLPRVPINDLWFDICDVHPSMLSASRR
ncbi:matrix metalloproteinase-21-like [Dendropsophus ebraccatus]|uniref:matrix metalloproteinase-21-like n=1 Tax=Dendropsophus ebraccatus TaxID=150705 RepID=UPI003831A508